MNYARLNIFCDFDGTISRLDVTDELLQSFAPPAWQDVEREWKAGLLGSRECMRRQIEMLRCGKSEIDRLLGDVGIDPDFSSFVSLCRNHDWKICVVSDGIDYAIQTILGRNGLDGLPVYSNRLSALGSGDARGEAWSLDFPHSSGSCSSGSGVCKCGVMRMLGGNGGLNILIGDGASDFCAAAAADLVLAKDKLLDHCQATGLPHIGFADFGEAARILCELDALNFMQGFSLPKMAKRSYSE